MTFKYTHRFIALLLIIYIGFLPSISVSSSNHFLAPVSYLAESANTSDSFQILDGVTLRGFKSSEITIEKLADNSVNIRRVGSGSILSVQYLTYQDRNFLKIGNRLYEKTSDTAVELSDLIVDPLLWIGNATLVDFFGEGAVLLSRDNVVTPNLTIVQWNQELRKVLPVDDIIPDKLLDKADIMMRDPLMDPFLKTHYNLVYYFFKISPFLKENNKTIPYDFFEVAANIGPEKLNELFFALFGSDAFELPVIVPRQIRLFYQMLVHLHQIVPFEDIKIYPENMSVAEGSTALSYLHVLMQNVSYADLRAVKNFDDFKRLIQDRVGKYIGIDVVDEGIHSVLKINTYNVMQDRRGGERNPILTASQKRPVLDKDTTVVDALFTMAEKGDAAVINNLFNSLKKWDKKWAVSHILQGIILNNDVKPKLAGKTNADMKQVLLEKKMGVARGGFGLGGASIETMTWVRDVFSHMFDNNIEVMGGIYKDKVDFGSNVNETRGINYFIDTYSYSELTKLIFSQKKIENKDLISMLNQLQDVISITSKQDAFGQNPLVGVDSISNVRARKKLFFKEKGLDTIIDKLNANKSIDNNSKLKLIQGVYDFSVQEVKNTFLHWVKEKQLDVMMVGQIAFPVENPVVYAGLLEAVKELDHNGKNLNLFIRQSYFRKWEKQRENIDIVIPSEKDGVEIFVESQSNADIFEELYGYRPSVVYEGVRLFDISVNSDLSIQEQLQKDSMGAKGHKKDVFVTASKEFKDILDNQATLQGKEKIDLNKDIMERDIIILQPSRMDSNKRPDSTLELASMLQEKERKQASLENRKMRKVRVLFLGEYMDVETDQASLGQLSGNERDTYIKTLQQAKDLGLDSQVYFLGQLKQTQVLAAMSYAHIMSQPSDRETFGRTPMEAISMGTPIVVSRDYVYPYYEQHQVFRNLFGGYALFPLKAGQNNNGEWTPGPSKPDEGMANRIWETLNNRDEINRISKFNYFLLKHSMMNLNNFDKFMELWNLSKIDGVKDELVFIDNKLTLKNAEDSATYFRVLLKEYLSEKLIKKLLKTDDFVSLYNRLLPDQQDNVRRALLQIQQDVISSHGIIDKIIQHVVPFTEKIGRDNLLHYYGQTSHLSLGMKTFLHKHIISEIEVLRGKASFFSKEMDMLVNLEKFKMDLSLQIFDHLNGRESYEPNYRWAMPSLLNDLNKDILLSFEAAA